MTATTIRVQMAQRKDTAANWTAANPILLSGEIGYETDNKKFKIGDGITNWNSLAYLPIPDGSGNLTITGNLEIGSTGSLTFEGSTADGFETTLAVTNPTADRTITLPDRSGTVITSGDTGTVTSTMLADGTIVDADVNASAAIAGTKISPNFGSQTIQTTGIFSHALGTAGAPTVTFTGDPNTGIYSPGADQLAVATGGTGRLFITSTGLVGINTTSPSQLLHVNGNALVGGAPAAQWSTFTVAGDSALQAASPIFNFVNAAGSARFAYINHTGTGGDLYLLNQEAGALRLGAGNAERLRITSAGLVGVGTSSPGQLLDAQGNSNPQIKVSETNNSTSAGLFIENQGQRNWQLWADRSTDTFRLGNNSRATTNVAVDSTGRVGIGTTSPANNLHVEGGALSRVLVSSTSAGARTDIAFRNSASTVTTVVGFDGTNSEFDYRSGDLAFKAVGTERARIDSSGRLLVGTSSALAAQGVTSSLQLHGATAGQGSGAQSISYWQNNTTSSALLLNKSRGATPGSYTIVQNGDGLGTIAFGGADGTAIVRAAVIDCQVDGTPGTNDMPGRIVFSTTADGASSPTERMRITSAGNVGIGTTSPGRPLEVNGIIRTTVTGTTSDAAQAFEINNSNAGADPRVLVLSGTNNGSAIIRNGSTTAGGIQFHIQGGEAARIDSSGRLLVGASATSSNSRAIIQGSSGDAFGQGILRVALGANNPADGTPIGSLAFTDSGHISAALVTAQRDAGTWASGSSHPTRLVFSTTADGASSPTERLRITNDGVQAYNQPAPAAVNATATLTVANLKAGIITSTSAAATDMTLPTGTDTQAGFSGTYDNFTFAWSVINTGPSLVRVLAATAHTIVGSGSVATGTSGRFASRRTAANTFVTYRLS